MAAKTDADAAAQSTSPATLPKRPNVVENPGRLADPRHMRDFLPYRLVQLVSVAGAPVTRWCEGRFGITRRHWRVISILAQEGMLLSSQLADHLELDRARTSRALGEMEAKHLVVRSALPGNARHVRVNLTAQGRAIFDELRPLLRQHHLSLLAAFSAEQVRDFDAMLATLLQQSITINAAYGSLPKANRRAGLRARQANDQATAATAPS